MKINDFLAELSEELELDTELNLETDLLDLEEWDSMAVMVVIAYVSEHFNHTLTGNDFEDISNVESLIDMIGKEKFTN